MRRTLILSLLLLALLPRLAGQAATPVDSLFQTLPTLTDQQKLKVYQQIIQAREWDKDTKTTLRICDEWIACAQTLGDLDAEEQARNRKLTVIYNSEDWTQLVAEATQQRQWMEQHKRWDSFYKAWRDIMEGYSYDQKPQTALREAQSMRDHAQKMGNDLGLALAYQQMGVIYDNIDHTEAMKAFEHSLALMKKTPGTEGNEMLSAFFYMAQELDQLGNYDYELRICREWKQQLDETTVEEHETESRMNVHYLECHLWNASALIGLNRLDEAEQALRECERRNASIEDPYLSYQIQVHRAHLALQRGDVKTAEAYSDQFGPMMDSDQWPLAQRLYGEILMRAGRNADAALFYRKIYEQKDSTFSKDVRMQLDEFNTLFQLDEIKMKGELERSRFTILIIVLIVVALLFIIFLRHRSAQRLKQKNRELTIANARAEESSKMKTNFIQQISHEIRTPLNILSGFTQIVTTPGVELGDAEKADISKRITENTERITKLVNKMLELSDASSQTVIDHPDHVTAAQIATEAVMVSDIAHASHITFDLQIDEEAGAAMLHTNLRYAVRALSFLLDNAQKFTKQGTATLRVGTSAQQGRMVAFTVEDTGIGIPAAEAERVFDEFVQLDEYYDGTGIGLTVARSIARRLDGDIVLDTSYSTGGARFVMTLPTDASKN